MAGAEFMCSGKNMPSRQLSLLSFLTELGVLSGWLSCKRSACRGFSTPPQRLSKQRSRHSFDRPLHQFGPDSKCILNCSQTHEGIDAKTDDSTMKHRRTIDYMQNCTGQDLMIN
jgi:hypothetical protein